MWAQFFSLLRLALLALPPGAADLRAGAILLPVEVLGEDGTTVNRTVFLADTEAESAHFLWLQVHGIRYPEQASVKINSSAWIPLRNDTVTVAEPGLSLGGIGGGFSILQLSLSLPGGALVPGANTIRFRFNCTDGLASGYRVLRLNLLTAGGDRILSEANFVEDAPETWLPPRGDEASVRAGKRLWLEAPLVASSKAQSPRIQARCADCHARDGRDLKYFNFSNVSIIARSRFHGLTTSEGEQIASYIRSLPGPNPGRPWNPPYQPGPGLDQQPVSNWAAGAGFESILTDDPEALPYFHDAQDPPSHSPALDVAGSDPGLHALPVRIRPDIFRPDGNLNAREIPISLQLPDWSQWLPRIHPKDAWGPSFEESEFAGLYDGGVNGRKPSLHRLLASSQTSRAKLRTVRLAWNRWSVARRAFLGRYVNAKSDWSAELAQKVYSTQLWQLVKTWEMTQEFELEGQGRALLGSNAEPRTWCNTIPSEAAPATAHIPNGPMGIGGSALTNEYLSSAWYQLQIILNSGNHQHRGRTPVDWIYVIGHFQELYARTHRPEPARLLVVVTKALQSTDPGLGPDDFSQGWRPDQSVDPRIMISPQWQPIFKPLTPAVRRALTEALLSGWIDKNLQYSIARFLPLPSIKYGYKAHGSYTDISGGKVWNAAEQFRAAGVSDDLIERLRHWGLEYTDRASRIQYH